MRNVDEARLHRLRAQLAEAGVRALRIASGSGLRWLTLAPEEPALASPAALLVHRDRLEEDPLIENPETEGDLLLGPEGWRPASAAFWAGACLPLESQEVQRLRHASRIVAAALTHAAFRCRPGLHEAQAAALLAGAAGWPHCRLRRSLASRRDLPASGAAFSLYLEIDFEGLVAAAGRSLCFSHGAAPAAMRRGSGAPVEGCPLGPAPVAFTGAAIAAPHPRLGVWPQPESGGVSDGWVCDTLLNAGSGREILTATPDLDPSGRWRTGPPPLLHR